MGISITQPAPAVDRSYTPGITGFTRLWGGLNFMPNIAIAQGLTLDQFMDAWDYTVASFFSEKIIGAWWNGPENSGPALFIYADPPKFFGFTPKLNGAPIRHMVEVYANPGAAYAYISTDLNYRFVGMMGYWASPTTITASNQTLQIEDQLTGKFLTVPITQTDLDNINRVLSESGSTLYGGGGVAVSPLAGYVLVTYSCENVPSGLITFEALFKTTLDNTDY